MKNKFIYISLIVGFGCLLFLSFSNRIENKQENIHKSLTEDFIEDLITNSTTGLSDRDIDAVIDSLSKLRPIPDTLIKELTFYKMVRSKKEAEIYAMIDSLLEELEIPYELIFALNLYAESRFSETKLNNFYQNVYYCMHYDTVPAHDLYQIWSDATPYPYVDSIRKNDSTILLKLTDEKTEGIFTYPLKTTRITSKYGWRSGTMHNGIDIDLQVWDSVYAAFDGKVRFAKYYKGYGRVVIVRHYNGLETLYAHLHRFKVKVGQEVKSGDLIGLGGSSGKSTGSHLHFEVRYKGMPINPQYIIDIKHKKLLGDTVIVKKQKWNYACYPKGTQFYTVQNGDYLYKISKQFGVPINKICELNGISRNSYLKVGQKLRVSS